MNEQELLSLLEREGISFRRVEHEAVFSVAESSKIDETLKGARTKNFFLRDKRRRGFFLVVVEHSKRVDLKALAKTIGSDRFSFASPEKMKEMLGVESGSATVMAVLNDAENRGGLFIDRDIWESSHMSCHPLVNTATLELANKDFRKFLSFSGKDYRVIDVPVLDGE